MHNGIIQVILEQKNKLIYMTKYKLIIDNVLSHLMSI